MFDGTCMLLLLFTVAVVAAEQTDGAEACGGYAGAPSTRLW